MQTLEKILTVWSHPTSIKNTSYEQHRYLTAAIICCIKHLDGEGLHDGKKQGTVDLVSTDISIFCLMKRLNGF